MLLVNVTHSFIPLLNINDFLNACGNYPRIIVATSPEEEKITQYKITVHHEYNML